MTWIGDVCLPAYVTTRTISWCVGWRVAARAAAPRCPWCGSCSWHCCAARQEPGLRRKQFQFWWVKSNLKTQLNCFFGRCPYITFRYYISTRYLQDLKKLRWRLRSLSTSFAVQSGPELGRWKGRRTSWRHRDFEGFTSARDDNQRATSILGKADGNWRYGGNFIDSRFRVFFRNWWSWMRSSMFYIQTSQHRTESYLDQGAIDSLDDQDAWTKAIPAQC